jgi:hypothetical protein
MLSRPLALGLLVLAPFALATPALASFPVSVWAIPDSVDVEGADTKQPSVTITGFMMAFIDESSSEKPGSYGQYSVPRWGAMHYECPAGMAKTCLMEWDDIAKKIDADDCVGWGSQDVPPGLIQPLYAEVWTVDTYPFGSGVVSGFTPCQALDAAYVQKPLPPMPDPGPEVGEDAGPGPDVDAGPGPDVDAGPLPDIDAGPLPDIDADVNVDIKIDIDAGPGPDSDIGPPPDASQDVDGGAFDGGPSPDIEDVPPFDADIDFDALPDGWAFDTDGSDTWVDWDGTDEDAGPPPDADWDVPPDSAVDIDAGPTPDVSIDGSSDSGGASDTVGDGPDLWVDVDPGPGPDATLDSSSPTGDAVSDTGSVSDSGPDAAVPSLDVPVGPRHEHARHDHTGHEHTGHEHTGHQHA